jgi:hypothetical protein
MIKENGIFSIGGKAFGVLMGGFVADALDKIIIWLIVMFSVVICDLIAWTRMALLTGVPVRFSRSWRYTFGKMITYFSLVVMFVFIDQATGNTYNIARWAILFVCGIEAFSIFRHILKTKGYDIDLSVIISVLLKKLFKIEMVDSSGIITKKNRNNETEQDT